MRQSLAGRFEEVEMKRPMHVSLVLRVLLLLAAAPSLSGPLATEPGEFRTTLTNSNDSLAVTVSGDDVWVGTTGGLVHWNRVSMSSSLRSMVPSMTSLRTSILPRALRAGRFVRPKTGHLARQKPQLEQRRT